MAKCEDCGSDVISYYEVKDKKLCFECFSRLLTDGNQIKEKFRKKNLESVKIKDAKMVKNRVYKKIDKESEKIKNHTKIEESKKFIEPKKFDIKTEGHKNINFSKREMVRTKTIALIAFIVIISSFVLFLVVDADGDGLNNLTEIQHGTTLFNSDSDSDGLSDGNEINVHHTNPLDNDCDKDNILDGAEINYGTNPLSSDSDNDGLNDYTEINTYHTNPLNADNDNDGLTDGDEVRLGTDLFNPDTDNDGYQDGMDPHPTTHEWKLIDSDNDGWNDYKEYYEEHTDRFNSDSDYDGLKDSADPHPTTHEWKLIDSDNDGWNDYKEYYETGTDRFNADTDGDGAPDSKDANPLNAAYQLTRDFSWDYPSDWWNTVSWTWTIQVSQDLYKYESQLPRIASWYDWAKYTDDPVLGTLAPGLKEAAENKGFDYYEKVNFVLAFVHSFQYLNDTVIFGREYPRYPIETLVAGGGDCEDTSFLVAGILKVMNYDVCLLEFPDHMAVGVLGSSEYPGTSYNINEKHYYYCETTNNGGKMGEIPPKYEGKSATIIQIQ